MSETMTQVDPWMTVEEAEAWVTSAIQAHYDLWRFWSAVLDSVMADIHSLPSDRYYEARKHEQNALEAEQSWSHIARLHSFCAAILRAVKT